MCRTASFRQRRTLALGSRCDSRDFGPLRLILHAVPGPARRGRALALVLSATCSLLCLFLSLLLDPRCTGTTLALQGPPTAVKRGRQGQHGAGPDELTRHRVDEHAWVCGVDTHRGTRARTRAGNELLIVCRDLSPSRDTHNPESRTTRSPQRRVQVSEAASLRSGTCRQVAARGGGAQLLVMIARQARSRSHSAPVPIE